MRGYYNSPYFKGGYSELALIHFFRRFVPSKYAICVNFSDWTHALSPEWHVSQQTFFKKSEEKWV